MTRDEILAAVRAGASLTYANLTGANLTRADLRDADLRDADLTYADLTRAKLTYANLTGADLRGADLRDADLRDAKLTRANLTGANLTGADLGARSIVPDVGAFTAWKALRDNCIARLTIPADARRVSPLTGRKCRAEYAVVEAITASDGSDRTTGESLHEGSFTYTVGQTVRPDAFDDDIRVECSNGIHFFITQAEAKEY